MTSEEYGKIQVTLHHLVQMDEHAKAARLLLNELMAEHDAKDDVADYRRTLFRVIENDVIHFPVPREGKRENPDVGTPGENGGFVEFTEKEIQQMPKQFKTEYRIKKKIVHVRHHKCGTNSWTYELRYRKNGYNITACGKTIEIAKANFLKKLETAQKENPELLETPTTFSAFALYHFEQFRKKKVSAQTYRCDLARLNLHILPYFKEIQIKRITPAFCQKLIERLTDLGKMKTAQEVYCLISIVFKSAILHGIIERNPLDLVQTVEHESEHGTALTPQEQETLLAGVADTPFQAAFALALYTGLRPNEYKSARIEGEFVVAINSKRHNKKVEYKKIPICNRLADYLTQELTFPCLRYMRDKVKELVPGHKLYDLRTTFYSRCKELGVAEPALKEYVGHSGGTLANAYTDLSDEYLLKEGKKLNGW